MGEDKNFTRIVDELTTMLDYNINPQSAKLYSTMTREDLIKSLEKIANLDNEELYKVIENTFTDNYFSKKGIIDNSINKLNWFYDILNDRKNYLSSALELIKKTPQQNDENLLKYLEKIKEKLLTTPLTEFETYQSIYPKTKTSFFKKIFNRKKTKTNPNIIQNMLNQREQLLKNDEYKEANELLARIKDRYNYAVQNELRGGSGKTCEIENPIKKVEELLSKGHLLSDTVLYRVSSPFDFGYSCMGLSSKDFLNIFYKKGDYFTIPIFPNTTVDNTVLKKFFRPDGSANIIFKINAPKGTPCVTLEKLQNAKYQSSDEKEILLQHGLTYRFKQRIPYLKYDVVELDLVNNVPKHAIVHNFADETETMYENYSIYKYIRQPNYIKY